MQGERIRQQIYYRCVARTLAPGSPSPTDHPKTVNLRDDQVIGPLNDWISSLFAPANREQTAAEPLAAQDPSSEEQKQRQRIQQRLTDAETAATPPGGD